MVETLFHYRLLAGAWLRAAWQFRASTMILTAGTALSCALDFALIGILFGSVPALDGFGLAEVAFLYGTSSTAFTLSNLLFGSTDQLGQHLRDGTLDVMMIRPVRLLVQVAADQFSPRRFGGISQGAAVLVAALAALDVEWTLVKAGLVVGMLASGTVIFCAVWTIGSAFQFVVPAGHEAVSAFTYGGEMVASYPLSIYGRHAMVLLTFVLPLAFVNWQPALYIFDRSDPLELPTAFRFASPLAAVLACAVAAVAWRAGVRRYRSTGS